MNKLSKRLLSLLLSVFMVVESSLSAGITGYATENSGESNSPKYLAKAVASLPDDVSYQVVEFGTPEKDLELPEKLYALVCEAKENEDDGDDEAATGSNTKKATSSEATGSSLEATGSTVNKDVEFITDEQREIVSELLYSKTEPSKAKIEKETGLNLKNYVIKPLKLKWVADDFAFGGEYDAETPGTYQFRAEVIESSKFEVPEELLPVINVEVLEDGEEKFLASEQVDGVEITVSAPAGVFPKGSKLQVSKIDNEDDRSSTLKINEAVTKALASDLAVKNSLSFDIKVVDEDGDEVTPDYSSKPNASGTETKQKISITFKSDEIKDAALDEDQYLSVFHFENVDYEDVKNAAKSDLEELDFLESAIEAVKNVFTSLITLGNANQKLKQPKYLKAEEIESESEDTEENSSAPKTDDSKRVTEDGEITVKTTDFSVYTIAFYSEKAPIKAYYVTVSGDDNSLYSYEEGDKLKLEFSSASDESSEDRKLAALYCDEDQFEEFVGYVSMNPTDLDELLKDAQVGSTVLIPANLKTFGLIADSAGISVKAVELIRNDVAYSVISRAVTIDPNEEITHKGVYWDLDEKFYVTQDAANLQGKITYEISGFGDNGGKATISVIDRNGSERTLSVNSNGSDSASFDVDASDRSFTIDSTDIIKVKPADSENYSYTSSAVEDGAVSIVSSDPTSFIFTNLKDYSYVVHQTVKQDDEAFTTAASDRISYTFSGLGKNEEVAVHVANGSDVDVTKHTADDSGNLTFDLEARVASFSVLAKEVNVRMDSASVKDGSENNMICKTDLTANNLKDDTALELLFDVPKIDIELYCDGVKLSADKYTAKYTSLKELNDVAALFDVPEYRFRGAQIEIGGESHDVTEISNFEYVNGSAPADITEDATLKLNYSEMISYPVHIQIHNVTVPTDVKLKVSELDADCISEVYLLDKNTKAVAKQLDLSGGFYTFKTTADADYYLLLKSDDKNITLMIDNEKSTFQQHAGIGVDPVNLKKKTSDTDYDANTFYLEQYSSSIVLKKRWEDGGKNDDEKNALIGKDVEECMYLQYKIVDEIEGVPESGKWQDLTEDSMCDVLGYKDSAVSSALTPQDAGFTYTGPTLYEYNFAGKLYNKYVYRDVTGAVKTSDIIYRIAENEDIKSKYFSNYEDDDTAHTDNEDGTVLRNYKIQTYKATIKWNDKDAIKSGSENLDRPSVDEWISSVTLHKVIEGKADDAATMSVIPTDELKEAAISVTDNGDDTWTVEIKGYAYDKNDYNVHYYLTEELGSLQDTVGRNGNSIVNRRYEPTYDNKGSSANKTNGVYNGGTLINVLAGDTNYNMYKIWKDDGTRDTVSKRPTAKIIIYRYTGEGEDSWRHLSPIQNASYHTIEKNIGTDKKLYQLTIPATGYVGAYNEDGTEFTYIGKESMTGGSNSYVTTLRYKDGTEGGLHEGHFIYDGETLINRITGKVRVNATKTWVATARQDVESSVTLELYRTKVKLPDSATISELENYDGAEKFKSYELGKFTSEENTKSYSWTEDKYDEEGERYYYFVKEENVKTRVGDSEQEAKFYTDHKGNNYFVTADGYRYLQTVETKRNSDGNVDTWIKNTLVGNAQVKLVKSFPNGLSITDRDAGSGSFSFDVFQNKKKIGTIKKTYKTGSRVGKINDDGTVTYTELTEEQLKNGFTDEILIDRYDDSEINLSDAFSSFTGLLPRYDAFGSEYTYSVFEHEEDSNRGYYPNVVNKISEPTYKVSDEDAIQPYIKDKDKYLLDEVSISNDTGEGNYITVYKEWLDGGDADTRESISFVLEHKPNGSTEWSQIGQEYTIDPKATQYSKYVFVPITQDIKVEYTAFRNNGFKPTDTSGDFRVRETKVGGKEVHYYEGSGETIVDQFPNRDYYLGHDWHQYGCNEDKFNNLKSNHYEKDDYGFVQGDVYDYDVLLVDSETANGRYKNYQYFEDGNDIGNRNFDFAISNLRVGVIYIDIEKTWEDGKMKDKARPDELELTIELSTPEGKKPVTVKLNDENGWKASLGPYRKYNDEGSMIDYAPKLLKYSDGSYEKFIYKSGRASASELYSKAYKLKENPDAVLTLGQDHHTGDVYSFKLHNTLTGTITPVVNKFWEDYDLDDGKTNKRPDIYSNIYRSYTDETGTHTEQIDKTNYYDYDWKTVLDEKTHNWWQVIYSPLPRFSENFDEYTYYIGETYASENRNEYAEIGAFPGSPEYTDSTKQVAKYSYREEDLQKLTLSDGTIVYAAKVTLDPDDAGTLVNRPRNKRTVSGVKIYNNLPDGYVATNLPDVKIQLWRKAYKSDEEERVHEYRVGTDDLGNEMLIASTSYLDTVLEGANALYKRTFTFKNADGSDAQVPKYDDTGRPYTYFIKEDADTEKERNVLKAVYDFDVDSDDTLTNGIQATNAYKPTNNYDITFYKKWTGFDPETGTFDDRYLDPEKDTPEIKVRLYRYLQDKDGNIISGTEELMKLKPLNKNGNEMTLNSDGSVTLKYDKDNKEYTACTWKNLVYYAPNLNPYKYVVSEKIESSSYERTYKDIYEATVVESSDGKTTLQKANDVNLYEGSKTVKHDNSWKGYDITVNGDYHLATEGETGSGSGYAAIINGFTKVRTSITIKKLWDKQDVIEYDDLKDKLLPDKVKFELYRIKYTSENDFDIENHKEPLITDIELSPANNWEIKIDNLLKYEPRGYYYRYYVREIIPDGWGYLPFKVETEDAAFWNGGKGIKSPNGVVYDEKPMITGRKNVLKHTSVSAAKEFKAGLNETKLSPQELKLLYADKAIPKTIEYRIYYQVDGTDTWNLLKNGNDIPSMQLHFDTASGKYYNAGKKQEYVEKNNLPAYVFDESTYKYKEIKYRAVEYSLLYNGDTDPIVRSEESIKAELEGKTDGTAFGNIEAVTSGTTKTENKNNEKYPHYFRTTVTNVIDFTKLDVKKTWDGEIRDFGSRIDHISFKLQRKLEGTDTWADVKENNKVVTKTISRNGDQKAVFDKLPTKDKNGTNYTYRAVETEIVLTSQYGSKVIKVTVSADDASSGNQTGGTGAYAYSSQNGTGDGSGIYSKIFKTDFTNRFRFGSIAVSKKWEDLDDRYKLRPQDLKVKLMASSPVKDKEGKLNKITEGGETKYVLESKTLNKLNNWKATWSELPVCDANDDVITYILQEYVIVNDKEVLLNSYDATSLIKLDGESEEEGYESKPVTVADDGQVEVSFTNKIATTSYIVEKYWDTDETDPTHANDDGIKKEVNVTLQRKQKNSAGEWEWAAPDGVEVAAVLSESNQYKHEWNDLPARDADGDFYSYRAVEQSIRFTTATSSTVVLVQRDAGSVTKGTVAGYNFEAEQTYTREEIGLTKLNNILKKGDFSITKMWDDDDDRDGIRPEKVKFHLQRKLDSDADWVTLPSEFDREIDNQTMAAPGEWSTATWEGLPVENALGRHYSYRVIEDDVDGYVLRLYNEEYSVVQRIIDALMDITKPVREFFYKLITGRDLVEEYYDKGVELIEGETVTVDYVNIHDLETVDAEVSKVWADQNDKYGERPVKLEAKLYAEYKDPETRATVSEIVENFELADGKVKKLDNPVILEASNDWKASWSNLPKYKKGLKKTEITYVVKESEVDGYTKEKSETTRRETLNSWKYETLIENKVATTSVIAKKYWDTTETDETDANSEFDRYVNVALQYTKDGEEWKPVKNYLDAEGNRKSEGTDVTAVLSKDNDYSFVWDDLPLYGRGGEKLAYRAVETSMETVRTVDGEEVRTVIQLDGKVVGAYNYDLELIEQENGTVVASLSNILKKGEFSITKVWDDDNNREDVRPDSVKFHLQRKLKSEADDKWVTLPEKFDREITGQTGIDTDKWSTASWSELPVKAPNGEAYIYRAKEDEVSGYEFRTDGGVALEEKALVKSTYSNIHKLGNVDITVTKKWDDGDNKYGDRPEKIKVALWDYYYNGDNMRVDEPVSQMLLDEDKDFNSKDYDEVTLSAKDDWTHTWKDLPEYRRGQRGKEINYYVKEYDFNAELQAGAELQLYDNTINGYKFDEERSTVTVTENESGKKIFEITIMNTLEPVEIIVRKNWENEYQGIGNTVTGAEVVLQRKTEKTDWENVYTTVNGTGTLMTHVINKTEQEWKVQDLPVCDTAGNIYQYRAAETRIYLSDGTAINVAVQNKDYTKGTVGAYVYTSDSTETETGFRTDITNRMDTASLKVSKIWNDENDRYKRRPKELKITLKTSTVVDGTSKDIEVSGLKKETVLNAANNWTDDTTWAEVPVYTADGKQIYYTFTEQDITSYRSSYKSVTYGTEARTGDGTVAARVYTKNGEVSEVTFTNSYTDNSNGGGGGGGGGGGNTPGGSDSTDDGEVLGANRPIPEEPEVLGATRIPQTGDDSDMIYYGIGAIFSLAVFAAWFYVNKKRKRTANVNK